MTNTTTKAVRATITLGDIELDVFQLPNGDYKYSMTQAFISIADEDYSTQQAAKRYIQICNSKKAQHLAVPSLQTTEKVKVDGENQAVKLISQADVMSFWAMAGFLGHTKAFALLVACGVEALERRADEAFGKVRDEEERNQRFIARKDSILQRFFWTDCIKWWLDNNEVSDNTRKFIYFNVSNKLNKAMFGMDAKEIRVLCDGEPSELVRDLIDPAFLPDITFLEKYAGTRVKQGLTPMQAIDEAIVFMQIVPCDPRKKA